MADLQPKRAAMGATLRVQVATHVAKPENAKRYKPFWTPDVSGTTVEKEDGDIPATWEAWMAAIRRRRRWICGLTRSRWLLRVLVSKSLWF